MSSERVQLRSHVHRVGKGKRDHSAEDGRWWGGSGEVKLEVSSVGGRSDICGAKINFHYHKHVLAKLNQW